MTSDERRAALATYARAYDDVRALLPSIPPDALQFRPGAGRWTIHEILIHLADSEANAFVRCRRILAEPGSAVLGYDQDKWADGLGYAHQSADDSLELFRWMRVTTTALLRMQPDAAWQRTVEHSERGTMNLDDWMITYADHIPGHIRQIQGNLAAWTAAKSA